MKIDVLRLDGRRAVNRWERVSVGDLFERVTWSFPDKEAIVGWPGAYAYHENERLTYRQAEALACKVANGLLAAGLKRSDRVMMVCENSVEAVITKIGIAKAGLVAVPFNPHLAPEVVAGLIAKVEPKFLVADAELWPPFEATFRAVGLVPGFTIPIGGEVPAGSVGFQEFVHAQSSVEPDIEIHGDDIWQILFTSGTTASPKGAMVSHHSSYLSAYSYAMSLSRGVKFECDMKLVSFLPIIFHASDQIFTHSVFLTAGTLIIGRRPEPEDVAAAVTREQATVLWAGSPVMVKVLADVIEEGEHNYAVGSLKALFFGWAALPPGTLAKLKRVIDPDLVVVSVFGQTESISCYRFWLDKWPEIYHRTSPQFNYVGVPNPILASDIIDEHGASLRDRPGVQGEAVYRSPALMAGYYKDLPATEEVFRGGWMHSGDSCIYDEHGLRAMVDRYKDIVKSGGENVTSLRVEAVVDQFPGVARSAVIGLPHKKWGEAVTAVVQLKESQKIDQDELLKFCRAHLAGYESPKGVIVVDSFPTTYEGGKVLKFKLRQKFATYYD